MPVQVLHSLEVARIGFVTKQLECEGKLLLLLSTNGCPGARHGLSRTLPHEGVPEVAETRRQGP